MPKVQSVATDPTKKVVTNEHSSYAGMELEVLECERRLGLKKDSVRWLLKCPSTGRRMWFRDDEVA